MENNMDPQRRFITKVKYDQKEVTIGYKDERNYSTDVIIFKSNEHPTPAFEKALERLAPFVCSVWSLEDSDARFSINVRGASFSESELRGIGVTVTATSNMPRVDGVLVMNTSHFHERSGVGDNLVPGVLTTSEAKCVCDLFNQAKRYLDGERAQPSLSDQEPIGDFSDAGDDIIKKYDKKIVEMKKAARKPADPTKKASKARILKRSADKK